MTQTMPFYHFTYRVLVVDDNPMALRALELSLGDEGFYVRTAANADDALEIMRTERFHVGIVDLRLNDFDNDDRAGLALITALHAIDPTLAVIILTATSDVQSALKAMEQTINQESSFRLWTSPAFRFRTKTAENLRDLPDTVREAFRQVHHCNLRLEIESPPDFMDAVIERVGTGVAGMLTTDQLREEVDELVRKLFADWDYLSIEPVTADYSGYSRAIVFKAIPRGARGQGDMIIAKIGSCALIEREVKGYRKCIRGMAGNFVPTAIEPAWRTRSLGGMVYTYAGLGGAIRDFAEYFRANDPAFIEGVVENLFRRTLSWQVHQIAKPHPAVDLRHLFFARLRLQPQELIEKRDALTSGDVRLRIEDGALLLDGMMALPDPVDFALNTPMMSSYAETNNHGDLHVHNVLIDDQNNAWLIDFANADAAPLFSDHAFFEMSLRIEVCECSDIASLYKWAASLTVEAFQPIPTEVVQDVTIEKAHRAIKVIRRHVVRGTPDEAARSWRIYMTMLFFIALRLTTVKFLSVTRRQHALIVAALLARRLRAEA
ncbi:MAG: response regulator [Chloroflexota bacterium]|nr:response regulator [Chloroflexota bacterium]